MSVPHLSITSVYFLHDEDLADLGVAVNELIERENTVGGIVSSVVMTPITHVIPGEWVGTDFYATVTVLSDQEHDPR